MHNYKKMTLKYFKNEEGLFVCPDCGVTKKNQSTMHYHIKKHQEELNYICKECKKGFLQKQTLDLHMKSKHPESLRTDSCCNKRFCCPFDNCEFSALTKGNTVIHCLRVHFAEEIKKIMNIDTTTNDRKSYHCNECCNDFNSSSAFMYHCKDCISFDKDTDKYTKLKEILN
jgi:hypothetical protein